MSKQSKAQPRPQSVRPFRITGMRDDWNPLQRAFFEAHNLPIEPRETAKVPKLEVYRALKQLLGCRGLLASAIEDIRPRVGESSKLARALVDVEAATANITRVTEELRALVAGPNKGRRTHADGR